VPLWGLWFSLPGFAHNTRKEYGQMLNPEVQDQISMRLYPTSGQLTVVECNDRAIETVVSIRALCSLC